MLGVRANLHRVCRDFIYRRNYAAVRDNCSGALHNRGESLWTYNVCLARHVTLGGEPHIVVNTRKYSVTSSKHLAALRREIAQDPFWQARVVAVDGHAEIMGYQAS